MPVRPDERGYEPLVDSDHADRQRDRGFWSWEKIFEQASQCTVERGGIFSTSHA